MKTKIHKTSLLFAFVLMLMLSATSCGNDNDDVITNQDEQQNIDSGTWKLVRVYGGIAGIDHSFTPGLITWTFDPVNHITTVVNNNTDQSLNDILESGEYIYQIMQPDNPEDCENRFTFDELVDMGCLFMENDRLIIDQRYADGFRLEFIQ
jgi:hypothetical protein